MSITPESSQSYHKAFNFHNCFTSVRYFTTGTLHNWANIVLSVTVTTQNNQRKVKCIGRRYLMSNKILLWEGSKHWLDYAVYTCMLSSLTDSEPAVAPLHVCSSVPAALPVVSFSHSTAHASPQVLPRVVVGSSPVLVVPDKNNKNCCILNSLLTSAFIMIAAIHCTGQRLKINGKTSDPVIQIQLWYDSLTDHSWLQSQNRSNDFNFFMACFSK